MSSYHSVVRFFQDGGLFMYPILFVLLIGIAIAVERYLYLAISKNSNKRIWKKLSPLLSGGEFDKAMAIASNSKAAIARLLNSGLVRTQTARRRDDIEIAMEEGMMEVLPRLEQRTQYLGTLANIATLLGLLGTIIGLIQAFTAVAQADPSQKADLLSTSISIAMNTTAFGLMVAIPLLLTFSLLQSKTNQIVDSLEMASVKFLNIFTQVKRFSAE